MAQKVSEYLREKIYQSIWAIISYKEISFIT